MRVVGTAGHVDHGKSTLIAALTGTHPDRLKEEQEREMTIELGFGWLALPTGEEVGIVDVPGHRDFIENMLAGVGGIDAALLVVAADEGVMPQTREHLAIIDLLQIPAGLAVLTKMDMALEPAWIELVESDIREELAGTVLQDAPIVRVSARTGQGLEELVRRLAELLRARPERPDLGRPRLPIDRVFSMAGFGTIVTGTLSDGSLSLADEVEILPGGQKGRVRGLQTHRKKEERAVPGSRTAVNISGVAREEIRRGDVLVRPGQYQAVRRFDASFRLLKDAPAALEHADQVKFFTGASESMATVRLLGKDRLEAGEEGWIQLELQDPVVAVRGDRYILRRPSPGGTLGGGTIVDHQPGKRHKRFDEKVLRSLEALAQGSPADILLEAALAGGIAPIRELVSRSRLEAQAAQEALDDLLGSGRLVLLETGPASPASDLLAVPLPHWIRLADQVLQLVSGYHANLPLRAGMPREELKSRLRLQTRGFNALIRKLAADGLLVEKGPGVALPAHAIRFNDAQQARVDELMRRFAAGPYSPPSVRESQAEVGADVLEALIEIGELKTVSEDVIFRTADYQVMVERIRTFIEQHGQITLAEVRDLLSTSRKYSQALLEYLDSAGITVREGDYRKLRR